MTAITLKKSSVSNKAPITTDLQYGELALNYADGRLYYKTSANTIDYFLAGGGVGDTSTTVYNYAGVTVDTFTGDGITTTFDLTATPSSINYTFVNVGGTFQPRSVYAVSGTQIILSSAPPNGSVLEVTTVASIDQVSTSVSWNDITDKPTIPAEYTLPAASALVLGGVKIGSGVSIDVNGVISAFSGSYNDLINKPTLFSGSYTDLTNKPVLFDGAYSSLTGTPTIPADIADLTDTTGLLFDGAYSSLTGLPTLFSGSYTDLTNKPTLFDGAYTSLTGLPTLFSGSYNDLTDIPTTQTFAEIITTSTAESIQLKGAATGTVPVSYSAGNVVYFSSISGDFTVNFTDVVSVTERSVVFVLIINQGNTSFIPNAVQIDGASKTINWANSTVPTPIANGYKVYTFTLLNLGSVWNVIAQMSEFGV